MMMHKQFTGLTMMVLGTLALLQVLGVAYFGLAFWPAVLLWIGLEILWSSLFDHWHGVSLFGAALGLFVGGLGLLPMLNNAGVAPYLSVSEMVRIGWPVLLVALGLGLLFRKSRWDLRRG